jgi:hypothetical protein
MADASQAMPIEDVRNISAITYGFMASRAALDLGLFTHIDCSRSPSRAGRWPTS